MGKLKKITRIRLNSVKSRNITPYMCFKRDKTFLCSKLSKFLVILHKALLHFTPNCTDLYLQYTHCFNISPLGRETLILQKLIIFLQEKYPNVGGLFTPVRTNPTREKKALKTQAYKHREKQDSGRKKSNKKGIKQH